MSANEPAGRRSEAGSEAWPAAAARSAFTLIELLIVIIILVLVISVTLPAFAAMLRGSEETLAQARLASAVKMGRDAAISQTGDADVAVVFSYPPGGRMTAITCVKVGQFTETVNGVARKREVFVPLERFDPVQFPNGWMVRGFAPPNSIDPTNGEWYEGNRYGGTINQGDWVFPETGFFNKESTAAADGHSRQTFMLRFSAGTGQFQGVSGAPVIVVLPRATSAGRTSADPYRTYRFDTGDVRRLAVRALTNPARLNTGGGGGTLITDAQRRQIIGDESTDTVLAGSVSQIALYREQDLARGVGASMDRETGCLYAGPGADGAWAPQFVNVQGLTERQLGQRVSMWINGDGDFDGMIRPVFGSSGEESGDRTEARIYVIDRASGDVHEVATQLATGTGG
jgi:prepilin-type N-terminal cleavage/methylation domain-containing protein